MDIATYTKIYNVFAVVHGMIISVRHNYDLVIPSMWKFIMT